MGYRLIASDIDGTLLDSRKRITPRVESAVRRTEAAGAAFCISSGRPLCGLQDFIGQLGLSSPVIACNGANVMLPDGTVLYECCLEPDAAMEILDFAERFGVTSCVWSHERLFVNEMNERTRDYRRMSPLAPVRVGDFSRVCAEGVEKILWHDEAVRVQKFMKILSEEMRSEVNFFTSNPNFLEFVNKNTSKAKALEWLAGYLGVGLDETMAIGDGFNDLEMLKTAGLGVAMANAADEIKAQCGWVAPSNDEDGVAEVLERFVLS